jgi:hypothetical protein
VQAFPTHGGSCLSVEFSIVYSFLVVIFSMAEELEELCRRLHLSDSEKNHLRLRQAKVAYSKQEAQFSILFKLLTSRPFNSEALKATVRNLWAVGGGVTIRDIEDNLFMAVFPSRDDLERVFIRSPWTFDKNGKTSFRLFGLREIYNLRRFLLNLQLSGYKSLTCLLKVWLKRWGKILGMQLDVLLKWMLQKVVLVGVATCVLELI